MSEAQIVKTIIHEMEHQKLHAGENGLERNQQTKNSKDVSFCV